MGELDAPDVSTSLQTAVLALRDRPVLFKYCIEEVATARHNALFQRFIAALTRGGPGGMPRPIEIHAHDPKRYINDMLAWVHQALADEREFVQALFGNAEAGGGDGEGAGGWWGRSCCRWECRSDRVHSDPRAVLCGLPRGLTVGSVRASLCASGSLLLEPATV